MWCGKLKPQCSGGRGRRASEFQASEGYMLFVSMWGRSPCQWGGWQFFYLVMWEDTHLMVFLLLQLQYPMILMGVNENVYHKV